MAGTITYTQTVYPTKGFRPKVKFVRLDFVCSGGAVTPVDVGPIAGRILNLWLDPDAGAGAKMTSTADLLLTDKFTGVNVLTDLSFGASGGQRRPTAKYGWMDENGILEPQASSTTYPNVYRDIFYAGTLQAGIANATTTDSGAVVLTWLEG